MSSKSKRPSLLVRGAVAAVALVLLPTCIQASEVLVDVNVDKPQAELSPVLYGLFYEDINYAADGGLYAELVENRSFEYYPLGGQGGRLHPLFAWSKVEQDGAAIELAVVNDSPLNDKNTKYLEITVKSDGLFGVRNTGFGGINIKQGDSYDFSVYARRTEDIESPITVALETPDGHMVASATIPAVGREWKKYEAVLTADMDEPAARLVLTTTGGGKLMLDMVSLFPQKTFKGRKNGMRPDLAQALADLKPGFLRFPGGCIVHGNGLGNTYRWKDTVGDVAERKPNWNRWGYHQSYGLGYFEYMQLCEDIGATPLPVMPVGVSCGYVRPFEAVPMDELQEWIDDCLDLIEFANGPTDTKWGGLRAEMGHPEPFGLEYICLGNEEHDTPEVRERFPLFVKAIRQRYPEIKIIGTSGLGPNIPLYDLMTELKAYSSDEHYYMPPSWYLANVDRFDKFDRKLPKIFVGEYASEGNTQFNAVAEAAYLTGIERNADIVDMTCYAPLFAKIRATQWPRADLIWFTNDRLMKTPNYYVQQLFSTNKGDVYLDNQVKVIVDDANRPMYEGQVGIGTWLTTIEVASAKLDGKPLDFSNWQAERGDFGLGDGKKAVYSQRDVNVEGAVSIAPQKGTGEKTVYQVRARKTAGREGFLLVFGSKESGDRYWWNVGGWRNTMHAIQHVPQGGTHAVLTEARGSIESNRWYDLKVELTPGRIRCFLDKKLIHDYRYKPPGVTVSPTLDKSTGEVLVKLVNPAPAPVQATVRLHGKLDLAGDAQLTTLAGPAGAVNTIDSEAIRPEQSTLPAKATMHLELPATSVQVIRVKAK